MNFKDLRVKLVSLPLSVALVLSNAAPVKAYSYEDVTIHDWFLPAVSYVVYHGLFYGINAAKFAPLETMSRGMFYTALARLHQAEVDNTQTSNYQDLARNQWYTGSALWAMSHGIATPESATSFGAHTPIKRSEVALAIYRYDIYSGNRVLNPSPGTTFADLGQLSQEERNAVAACQNGKIISGRADGRFDPMSSISRAEVAQVMKNYDLLVKKRKPGSSEDPVPEAPSDPPPEEQSPSREDYFNGTWTGRVEDDFPLGMGSVVTAGMVKDLNKKILSANVPTITAPQGESVDNDPKHLTNYGLGGIYDCIDVTTYYLNKNNEVDEGTELHGEQEYYGYSLQVLRIKDQDWWHHLAYVSGKGPWQCTWWVWGRAAQYLETKHQLDLKEICDGKENLGNGKDYYNALKPYFKSDWTPSPNSVISWSCGKYGHTGYVEAVDENGIWVSMADSGHSWRGITYIRRVESDTNPYPLNWFPVEYLNGFNHLDEPIK